MGNAREIQVIRRPLGVLSGPSLLMVGYVVGMLVVSISVSSSDIATKYAFLHILLSLLGITSDAPHLLDCF